MELLHRPAPTPPRQCMYGTCMLSDTYILYTNWAERHYGPDGGGSRAVTAPDGDGDGDG